MNTKKILSMMLIGIPVISLIVGCGANTETAKEPAETKDSADAEVTAEGNGSTLVVYYSATGNTAAVAKAIAEAANADLFEVKPAQPYSDADLDWTDEGSRVSREHENEGEREGELTAETADNWDTYQTVLVGYPVWWGVAAWPMNGFVKTNDFTGKTVIPFATSSTSDIGESGELLAEMAGTGDWLDGKRFSSGASKQQIQAWVEEAGLSQ